MIFTKHGLWLCKQTKRIISKKQILFCEVGGAQSECAYSENEKSHGFKPVWYTIDETLEKNGKRSWNERENRALRLIKEYFK